MMRQKFTTACNTTNLKKIRSFVSDHLHDIQLNDEQSNLVVLAVDEVCANIMIHSNQCNHKKHLEISIRQDDQRVIIEVSDEGTAFNPQTYQEPKLDEVVRSRKKGGIGMMLVRRIMDKIEYDRIQGRNICRLIKVCSNPAP